MWSSADGKNWSLETDDAEWRGRDALQAVSHNGRLYVLSGYYLNDVWSSADGKNWSLETGDAEWEGRFAHQAVSHNGQLYVLGGNFFLNDVWSSADGKNWAWETNAEWSPRLMHQALSHNGRLYVLGGSSGNEDNSYILNDVWSSADGTNWRQEKADNSTGWSRRNTHQAVVFPPNVPDTVSTR